METVTAPSAKSNAERQRRYRMVSPDKYYKTRTRYRHTNSKWQTDTKYLERPFAAYDGEGVTINGMHYYTLLAAKCEDDYRLIKDDNGIATKDAFEFLLACANDWPNAINVIYGGSYDFNMMLRDLTESELESVYRTKYAGWENYRLNWTAGKSLYLKNLEAENARGATIYDVVSFFQCPFVKACDEYLGDAFIERDIVVANKAKRGEFTLETAAETEYYNRVELDNLIALMTELRSRLNRAGLRPSRWDGPGAIASALLSREKVKARMNESPGKVAEAARFAYAGGRFEVIKFGHVAKTAYEYDVNSAYPAALTQVPDLTIGKWRHVYGDPGSQHFALYHLEWELERADIPGPLFRRGPNGTICYPEQGIGWYWSPEYDASKQYEKQGYGQIKVIEAWVYDHDVNAPRPFDFIEPLYNKRRALKKAKDGAHVGIKLGLNSLYGKLAQQVGAEIQKSGTWKIPPFHQIEWAGYTTSWCRAQVLKAALLNIDSVVAFETDALFTNHRLPLPIGTNLGEFECLEFDELTYVQSGLYFAKCGETIQDKTRGVDRGTITRALVLDALNQPKIDDRVVMASMTRFIGAGIALAQNFSKWRRWETIAKRVTLEPSGKRAHINCACMRVQYDNRGKIHNKGLALGIWHNTECPFKDKAHSNEFPIEWINPNPAMQELTELRETVEHYE